MKADGTEAPCCRHILQASAALDVWGDQTGRLYMFHFLRSSMIAAGVVGACFPAAAADPNGSWVTEGGKATVRIANCGGALCGTITALKEPNDSTTGRPQLDKNNADASKRSRPMIGVQIVLGMKPSGPDKWSGDIYNAEDGKTYSASLSMVSPTSLKLEGCVLKVLCKAQTWTRTN
jgi:uncharacterized protein (DUF2147 family)